MNKAIFFDFDGVVLDSVDIKTKVFKSMFSKFGRKVTDRVVAYHLENCGVSRYKKFKYYYNVLLKENINKKEMQILGEKFSSLVFSEVLKSPFISGALNFLKKYRNKYKFFIVSGTPETEIREITKVRKLDKYFSGVYGSPKTKKEIVRTILMKYKLDLKHSYFFGDAKTDLETAGYYHIPFVLIKSKSNLDLVKKSDICVKDFWGLKSRYFGLDV